MGRQWWIVMVDGEEMERHSSYTVAISSANGYRARGVRAWVEEA